MWLGYTEGKHKFGLSLDRYKLSTQTWHEDPSYEHFSVKIPDLTREKIGLFMIIKRMVNILKIFI